MHPVQIITDSTSDLPIELLKEKEIAIVPLYVVFGEKDTYKDGVEISTEDLYKKVNETGDLPKTSAPTPADFHNIFKPYIDKGKSIIYIGLSSQLSSTIQNAKIAASEFPEGKIEIIDSLNLSAGIGLLVLKASDYVEEGLDHQEIAAKIREMVPKMRTYFAIDTLQYLQKGGRCSSIQSFIGSMLKIRPILKVVEGKILLDQKTRGKREKTLHTLLSELLKDKDKVDVSRIVIIHSLAYEDLLYFKKELLKVLEVQEIITLEAGCVISSHCGPKTIGLMYNIR
ncbi:DegV family protein [Clostridium formicaceticum]|uniref:Fatty acid-binding protein n=1 Tax=Clostridium formicaceticum TaxID=1497 RepID=A0AAC9RK26_9CLOT|nr:DegV family protein [Clostridium formicaceticum]AOY76357.1 fatty acid-binding protein DegV [Clostridium formicaceticum]ARE86748.1 Fatty acid-binding protein [Clostridium formicaceticum]